MTSLRVHSLLFVMLLGIATAPRLVAASPQPPGESTRAAVKALEDDDPVTAEKILRPAASAGDADAQHLLGFLHDLGLGVPYDPKLGNEWQEKAAQQGHYWARLYLGWKLRLGLGVESPDPARADSLQAVLYEQAAPARVVPVDWLKVTGQNFMPNHPRTVRWLRQRAGEGDPAAAFTLAEFYYVGLAGGKPNTAEHLRWLQASADGNYAPALTRLKLYHALGLMVQKDPALSRRYLERAAAAGDADSQYELGRNYARGNDGPQDPAQAATWYRRAAESGQLRAVNALASLLRKGAPGVPADPTEARRLSSLAAERGDPEGQSDLAGMWRQGQGGPKDLSEARRLYRAAADQKYAYAQLMLGWIAAYDDKPPDYAEARSWFEIAANNGSETAMEELGYIYQHGRGVPVDLAVAFAWFEKAAREGDGSAQNQVGWMLRQGLGVERDDEEAVSWFRLAIKNQSALAGANLGYHYLHGRGVERDLNQAFDYLADALTQSKDPWTGSTFLEIFTQANPEEREALRSRLLARCEDPNLLKATGNLPEMCVQVFPVLGSPEMNDPPATRLMGQLAASSRPAAAALLALASFHGQYLPYNLDKARAWARQGAESDPVWGPFTLAYIDSVVGEAVATRASASTKLHQLADRGNRRAAMVLAYRHAVGLAEPRDVIFAQKYYAFAKPPQEAKTTRAVYEALGLGALLVSPGLIDPRDEADADAPPRPLNIPQPPLPPELAVARHEGKVVIEAIVTDTGRVDDLTIVSSTHPLLTESTLAVVPLLWQFVPARKAGKRVATRISQTFLFDYRPAP